MIDMSGATLSSLRESSRPRELKMIEALESRLADDEPVVSWLSASGTLTHETTDGTTERGGGDGGVLFVATDRKLVFVLDTPTGHQTADIPYTDLKDARVDSGFLSTTVSVTVWGRGQLRFSPSRADDLDEIAAYLTAASTLWQRVVAAQQDARQHVAVLGSAITDGRTADAEAADESALDCLGTARTRASDGPAVLRDALGKRTEAVETDRQRTRVESRIERGRALAEQTTPVRETSDYDATAADLVGAREQFETALQVATEEGFDEVSTIRAEIAALDERLATLETRPMARAAQALGHARRASNSAEAIERWDDVLRQYRETLEAGWGMAVAFDGETEALCYQIEWVVAKLLTLRTDRAEALVAEGDELAWTDPDDARDRYETACDHIEAAHGLAREYRAGDAAALATRLDTVRTKRRSVR